MSKKLGVSLNIDVTKIDKTAIYDGQKGKYLRMTVFIDPNEADQYGNHGRIDQDLGQERRNAGEKGAILGNAKVFWQGESQGQTAQRQAPPENDDFDDDIPF